MNQGRMWRVVKPSVGVRCFSVRRGRGVARACGRVVQHGLVSGIPERRKAGGDGSRADDRTRSGRRDSASYTGGSSGDHATNAVRRGAAIRSMCGGVGAVVFRPRRVRGGQRTTD
jgi:hypothetical protein